MKNERMTMTAMGVIGLLACVAGGSACAETVRIDDRLQVMWDDYIVDTGRTTAARVQHHPEPMETVLEMDRPWEGNGCSYMSLVPDEDAKGRFFRLYYIACRFPTLEEVKTEKNWIDALCRDLKACYAESRDGIHWTRPDLGICTFKGSKHNNIIADFSWGFPFDNWFVYKDTRPECPPDERYKALAEVASRNNAFDPKGQGVMNDGSNKNGPYLWCFLSADGIHFRKGELVTAMGSFDSLNTVHRNEKTGEYHLYSRGFHQIQNDRHGDNWARDIRHSVSKDFRTWTVPKLLEYTDGAEEYPLYTNLVQPYYRNPEILIALPTRYVERRAWTPNYDRLPSSAHRKEIMGAFEAREGLALTDCIFMMSRDGQRFSRCNEAFIRPGPEFPYNWVYGDCYPAYGFLLSSGRYPGSDDELSFLVYQNQMSDKLPSHVRRMRLRQDGFFSRQATYKDQVVVTKPLVFAGGEMLVNFSTSARGYMYVTIRDESGAELKSCELFGDKVDRVVGFTNGAVADFAGKAVTVEFRMSDADLYSFRFR